MFKLSNIQTFTCTGGGVVAHW